MEKYDTGIFSMREDNNMSLSCHGSVILKSGIIRRHRFTGSPRPNGDGWYKFFQDVGIGEFIDPDRIAKLFHYAGHYDVVATFKDMTAEEVDKAMAR